MILLVNILVTLNSNYIKPLKVMLTSLFLNNKEERFTIYIMQSSLSDYELNDLEKYIEDRGHILKNVSIDDETFTNAPILLHYTKEMYYRLLSYKFLPKDLDRILYLDPDILVLNPIKELYNINMDNHLYAAAHHNILPVSEINRIRFREYNIEVYYNTGVLLMNLDYQRKYINENDIFNFVRDNHSKLIMPDQDILNSLYSNKVKTLDEIIFNYDARNYRYYKFNTNNICDMDYVINNTVILHFCGKKKPWKKKYSGVFYSLYKHYEKLSKTI